MKIIALTALLLVSACATVTSEATQDINVATEPKGAACDLKNNAGTWKITKTPGTAAVRRDFSPLTITCAHEGEGPPMTRVLKPRTRGRAYGNILLLGLPATIDAGTGYGYEYAPDSVSLKYPGN